MENKNITPIEKDLLDIEAFLDKKDTITGIRRRLAPEMEILRRELEIDGYNTEKALLAYRTALTIEKYNQIRYHYLLTGKTDKKLNDKIVKLWDSIEEQKAKLELFFRPLRFEGSATGKALLSMPVPEISLNDCEGE